MTRKPSPPPSPEQPLAIASDHAGFDAKARLLAFLDARGVPTVDLGVHSAERADYPPLAHVLARGVVGGAYARGILLCGTGLGMSYAANRHPGIRAALCWSVEVARLARDHNDANVLVLPARVPTLDPVDAIVSAWLDTVFSGEARHAARIAMLDE